MDLVAIREIATMLGVSRTRVHQIISSDGSFPEPVAHISAGRIWKRKDVEAWIKRTRGSVS
jgi:prophage regulatory protein